MDKETIVQLLSDGVISNEVAERYFPELKESASERIRNFLHRTFTAEYLSEDKLSKWHGEPVANILAWLEKQGEQNHFMIQWKGDNLKRRKENKS